MLIFEYIQSGFYIFVPDHHVILTLRSLIKSEDIYVPDYLCYFLHHDI